MFSIAVVLIGIYAYYIGLGVEAYKEQKHKRDYIPGSDPIRTPYDEEKHQEMLDCMGDEARKNYNERSGRSNYEPSKKRK